MIDAKRITVLLLTAFTFALPAGAEVMRSFHSQIKLGDDRTAEVTEDLEMDFQGDERHGIIRQIPIRVIKRQTPYSFDLELVSITDGENVPVHFQEIRDSSEVEFKIGDPDKTVSGVHKYCIKYQVKRAINFINGKPEFYWNATGDQWRFPIEKATAVVIPPPSIPVNSINSIAFKGPPGSTARADTKMSADNFEFTCENLSPGEGLTIAVSLPIGTVHPPTGLEILIAWLADWWPAVLVSIASFATMYVLWFTGGRDEDPVKVVAVEWNPPKELSPAEVGTLVDEHCDLQDITSILVDLAARGYLKIKEIKTETFMFFSNKDYEFEKTDPQTAGEKLKPAELLFLNAIFPSQTAGSIQRLSALHGTFFPALGPIRQSIYESLTAQNLFRHNPEMTRNIYLGVAGVVLFCAVCAFTVSRPLALGLFIGAVIVACFSSAMPSRTRKGCELTRQSLGFARFVQKAEKERIRVLAAEDPTIFGRLLPYAMVLGAADQWANAFKDLAVQPPDWYVSSGGYDTYSTNLFVNDLGLGLRSMERTFTSVPAESSSTSSAWTGGSAFDGGGAGGGFGGGGGDSW